MAQASSAQDQHQRITALFDVTAVGIRAPPRARERTRAVQHGNQPELNAAVAVARLGVLQATPWEERSLDRAP